MPTRFVEVAAPLDTSALSHLHNLHKLRVPGLDLNVTFQLPTLPELPTGPSLAALVASVVVFVGNLLLTRALARRKLRAFGRS